MITPASVGVAISTGGGLFHAEYLIVLEGVLAWGALGLGYKVVQINLDLLADGDAFYYGAWVDTAVDVFLRTVHDRQQLAAGPTKRRVDGGVPARGTATVDAAGVLTVEWPSVYGARCVLRVKVPPASTLRTARRSTRLRMHGDVRLTVVGAPLIVELEAQRARAAAWVAAAALSREVCWWAPHVGRALNARARFEEAEYIEMWWWCVAFG